MKTSKPLRLNGVIIPAGTVLNFGNEGYAMYGNMRIARNQIPAVAIEAAHSQKREPAKTKSVLKHSIRLGETMIPAGEALEFNANGIANYKGKEISIYQIPSRAFTGLESDEMPNNQVNIEKQFKSFDALEPGDLGTNAEGEAIRFLGKAVGKAGYDALVGQFGDASGKTFEDITAGMSEDDINEAKFVAYTIPDGTVCIGIYDADHAVAVESDGGELKDFAEVVSGDKAVDADGKEVTIVATGKGSVWYKNMIDALKLECRMGAICERLGMKDDDDFFKDAKYALVVDGKNEKFIDIYGADGIKVIKEAE